MYTYVHLQVAEMADVVKIYDKYVNKLVKSLPMDDTCFIATLSAKGLLPGNNESVIIELSTPAEKAAYFLSHVIKPALDIDDCYDFNILLSIMQDCGYHHVQNLCCNIQSDIRNLDKGNYIYA